MSCDCFLLGGRVWWVPLMPLRRAGIESGMCGEVGDGLAWIMLAPRCGRVLGMLSSVETKRAAIDLRLTKGLVP